MTFYKGANEISTKRKKSRFLFLLAKNKLRGARRPLTSIYPPPTGKTKEIKDTEKWASTKLDGITFLPYN